MNYNDYVYEPIDLCSCYEPMIVPPQEVLDEWAEWWAARNPFRCTVERKIGNTWYLVETECDGNERLTDKVKRLMFSDKAVLCS